MKRMPSDYYMTLEDFYGMISVHRHAPEKPSVLLDWWDRIAVLFFAGLAVMFATAAILAWR